MRKLKHKWQWDLKQDKNNHTTSTNAINDTEVAEIFFIWCPFYRQPYSTIISLLTANSWSTGVPSTDITISTLDIGKSIFFSRNETSLKQSKSIILKLGAFFTPGSNKALKANSFIRHNARLVDINVVLGVFHLNLLNLKFCWTFCF